MKTLTKITGAKLFALSLLSERDSDIYMLRESKLICTGCHAPFCLQGDATLLWSKRTESASEDWVQIPAFSSCVTLGKPFNLIYKIRDHNI